MSEEWRRVGKLFCIVLGNPKNFVLPLLNCLLVCLLGQIVMRQNVEWEPEEENWDAWQKSVAA